MLTTAFLMCSCFLMGVEQPYYETKYLEWQQSVENIKNGGPLTTEYLAQHAEEYLEFLLTQLHKTPYTTIILQKSTLGKKYESLFKGVQTLEECQLIWIKVLSDVVYEKKFAEWRLSVEKQPMNRIVFGDRHLLSYLAQHADKHFEFLLPKLCEDRFTTNILQVMLVFQRHALERKGHALFRGVRGQLKKVHTLQKQQQIWIGVLSAIVYEEKFSAWQEVFSVELRKDGTPELQNDDPSRYLIQLASENRKFLRNALTSDKFVALLLEKSSLYEKYRDQIDLAKPIEQRKKAWSKLLLESLEDEPKELESTPKKPAVNLI